MKLGIPKGTRDFGPLEVRRRQYIFETIQEVFERFGFDPIETPAMENLSTLTGKYGEEGDQLLFKVLNNGDFLSKVDAQLLEEKKSNAVVSQLSKRGMRYDLTVPFARYVVMHQNDLSFPFKRYQIQPVWRADRPQKGRYQEFYQCDVDVVGSRSLMFEAELIQIYDQVFTALETDVEILLNHRLILEAMAETAGVQSHFTDMVVSLDKLDKIGAEKVQVEMEKRGIDAEKSNMILSWLSIDNLQDLKEIIGHTESGSKGIEELECVQEYLEHYTFGRATLKFDITLARGLSYYTGCVFEVKSTEVAMGSIGGGGRYDDLTTSMGLANMSGVGISFGAERIYLVLEELNRFPAATNQMIDLFVVAMDAASHRYAFNWVSDLRKQGVASALYPEPTKMKKMMKYANAIDAPYVIVIGEQERSSDLFSLKNMSTGEQIEVEKEQVATMLRKLQAS